MSVSASRQREEASVDQLRELSEIGRALTYAKTMDQVAQLIVTRGAALLYASTALIMLLDAEGLLHVRATFGIEEERVMQFRAPLTHEVINGLRELLGVPDESFVAVPLVVGGAVTGIIATALQHTTNISDEWLLSALADMAAVGLENARLGGEVRVEMEARLRISELATDAKDKALSMLAHDIRSPLGAIEGYCAIMEGGLYGPITEKQREAVGRIRMSGRHLLSLLDNVMDMARLNAGVGTVTAEAVVLADVAHDAIDIMLPAASARLHALHLVNKGDVVASGDHARVRQVLVNLLGNAIKFTRDGGTISVTTFEMSDDLHSWGVIRVTDTGPGIAAEELASIFEPYYRSETTAVAPGIGLGLAISHGLVRRMGGELDVESVVGAGSSFTVRLPLAGLRLD